MKIKCWFESFIWKFLSLRNLSRYLKGLS